MALEVTFLCVNLFRNVESAQQQRIVRFWPLIHVQVNVLCYGIKKKTTFLPVLSRLKKQTPYNASLCLHTQVSHTLDHCPSAALSYALSPSCSWFTAALCELYGYGREGELDLSQ